MVNAFNLACMSRACRVHVACLTSDLFEHEHAPHGGDDARARGDDRKRHGHPEVIVGDEPRRLNQSKIECIPSH